MKSSSSTPTPDTTEDPRWKVRPGGMLVQRRETDDRHHDQDQSGPLINVRVSHGPSQFDLSLPSQSTFGFLKQLIQQKTGLDPKQQKILFRGQEKEDEEYLHEAGVKDKSKVLLLEEPVTEYRSIENIVENEGMPPENNNNDENEEEILKACRAIDEIRVEVDMLADRVSALEVAVRDGNKIAEEEFVVSSELLMRQLLKLDAIQAQGDAKLQRKAEVQRVQKFQDTLDNLKLRNSMPVTSSSNAVTVATEWETFDSGVGSLNPPPPMPSSTRITEDWERFE